MAYKSITADSCPDWFELDAYEYVQEMSEAAWIVALLDRLELRLIIDSLDGLSDSTTREECRSKIRSLFEDVKNRSVEQADLSLRPSKGSIPPVSMLDVNEVRLLNDSIKLNRRKVDEFLLAENGQKNALIRLMALEEMQIDEFINLNVTDFPQTHRSYVHFDVAAPLAQLLEQFREVVVKQKKLYRTTTKSAGYNEVDYKKWASSQVLAFLDLTAWFRVEQQTPGDQNLGLMLFPDDVNITLNERIRKVVRPLADKLMSTTTIYAIWASALKSRSQSGT
jgi:hypothetical protein